jgi:hypothetical protein
VTSRVLFLGEGHHLPAIVLRQRAIDEAKHGLLEPL